MDGESVVENTPGRHEMQCSATLRISFGLHLFEILLPTAMESLDLSSQNDQTQKLKTVGFIKFPYNGMKKSTASFHLSEPLHAPSVP